MADEARITRVARAVCVTDGNDPEAIVTIGMDLVEEASGERNTDVMAPAWYHLPKPVTSEARRSWTLFDGLSSAHSKAGTPALGSALSTARSALFAT